MKISAIRITLLFACISFAHVTLVSPNGGETYNIGDTITISWEADETVEECYIKFSPDNGINKIVISGRNQIIREDNEGWGTFKWVVPPTLILCVDDDSPDGCTDSVFSTSSSSCKIMIDNPYNTDPGTHDFSDHPFTINPVDVEKDLFDLPACRINVCPNPFNPSTAIKFSLPGNGSASILIVDQLGRVIDRYLQSHSSSGNYEILWNAGSNPAGNYLVKVQQGARIITKKMVLVK
jgi:hypothetical protein